MLQNSTDLHDSWLMFSSSSFFAVSDATVSLQFLQQCLSGTLAHTQHKLAPFYYFQVRQSQNEKDRNSRLTEWCDYCLPFTVILFNSNSILSIPIPIPIPILFFSILRKYSSPLFFSIEWQCFILSKAASVFILSLCMCPLCAKVIYRKLNWVT